MKNFTVEYPLKNVWLILLNIFLHPTKHVFDVFYNFANPTKTNLFGESNQQIFQDQQNNL